MGCVTRHIPEESSPQIHFKDCLKLYTHIFPASVPTHTSPFAASTVGEPNVDDPSTVEACCDVVVNMCCVILPSSVHLKTSRSEDEIGFTCWSPDEPVCRFDMDDMRDMSEKCEGEGEAPSWREC